MPLKTAPFQNEGSDFLSNRTAALLADEMGLGKSVQVIRACESLAAHRVLIVCPATLKLNWVAEFKKWCGDTFDTLPVFGRKACLVAHRKSRKPLAIILNYELLLSIDIFTQLKYMQFDVGVFDEAHYLKSRSSGRTKAVLKKYGVASRCKRKWFLTGTPVLNRPVELFPILKAASPETIAPYSTYTSFAAHFCGGYYDGFTFQDGGATNTGDLNKRLRSGFMLRRKKSEVLPQLPEKRYQLLAMPSPSADITAVAGREFNFVKGDAKRVRPAGSSGGAELALLRQELAIAKIPTAIELITGKAQEVPKLVVGFYHREVGSQLYDALTRFNPVMLWGGMSALAKQKQINAFQDDPDVHILLGQIQVAGVGINLTAAADMFLVETSWVPGEIDQLVDRIHRIGQEKEVTIQFLVIENSAEEGMLRAVIDKRQVVEEIVEVDIFA